MSFSLLVDANTKPSVSKKIIEEASYECDKAWSITYYDKDNELVTLKRMGEPDLKIINTKLDMIINNKLFGIIHMMNEDDSGDPCIKNIQPQVFTNGVMFCDKLDYMKFPQKFEGEQEFMSDCILLRDLFEEFCKNKKEKSVSKNWKEFKKQPGTSEMIGDNRVIVLSQVDEQQLFAENLGGLRDNNNGYWISHMPFYDKNNSTEPTITPRKDEESWTHLDNVMEKLAECAPVMVEELYEFGKTDIYELMTSYPRQLAEMLLRGQTSDGDQFIDVPTLIPCENCDEFEDETKIAEIENGLSGRPVKLCKICFEHDHIVQNIMSGVPAHA